MNFETMLEFFTPDADVLTKNCVDCGAEFTVAIRQSGHKVRCKDCQKARSYQKYKNRREIREITQSTNDPLTDLVLAIIRQGQREGDKEWLQAKDGAISWVRMLGVNIDKDTEILFSNLT